MNITKEELAAQFERLSNYELLRRVGSGTMTPLALEAACEELGARGVEFESPKEQAVSHEDGATADTLTEESHASFDFVTIAHLVNPLRANLLRAHLQSEGIVVHVLGEHLGVMHMLLSAGTGGIHVQVRNDQVERARVILAEFDRIEQTVDEATDEDEEHLQSREGEAKHYSPGRDSPYSPPKSHVADVQQAKARRESLNKPSSPLFFWIFTLIAIGAAFYVLASA